VREDHLHVLEIALQVGAACHDATQALALQLLPVQTDAQRVVAEAHHEHHVRADAHQVAHPVIRAEVATAFRQASDDTLAPER